MEMDKRIPEHPSDPIERPAGRPLPRDPDAALLQVEVAHLTGLSPRTLEGLRVSGDGPVFFRVRRAIRYRRRDVIDWVEARRRQSTSEA